MTTPTPCLAVERRWRGSGRSKTTMFSVARKEPVAGGTDYDELADKAFCPMLQGWVLVRNRLDAGDTYLLDHRTGDKIRLPPLAIDPDLLIDCTCLLSHTPPASPSCVLVVVQPDEPVIWYVHVNAGGEDCRAWTRHEYDIGTQGNEVRGFESILMDMAAARRGKFYFVTSPIDFGVLEFSPAPTFTSYVVTEDDEEGGYDSMETGRAFLVESGDELYMVKQLTSRDYNEALVYKLEESSTSSGLQQWRWRPVHDLGGRAFFVAHFNFGASCVAPRDHESGIQPNCVYSLVKVFAAGKCLRVFDVTDGTMQLRSIEQALSNGATCSEGLTPSVTTKTMMWMLPTDPKAAAA